MIYSKLSRREVKVLDGLINEELSPLNLSKILKISSDDFNAIIGSIQKKLDAYNDVILVLRLMESDLIQFSEGRRKKLKLNKEELRVLNWFINYQSSEEISVRTGYLKKNLHTIKQKIFQKYGVHSHLIMIVRAFQNGDATVDRNFIYVSYRGDDYYPCFHIPTHQGESHSELQDLLYKWQLPARQFRLLEEFTNIHKGARINDLYSRSFQNLKGAGILDWEQLELFLSKRKLRNIISVGIVEDQSIIRMATTKFLNQSGEFNVILEVSDGLELINMLPITFPDVIILDVHKTKFDGWSILKRVLSINPEAKVIISSLISVPELIIEAYQIGACAFLNKDCKPTELSEAIKQVNENGIYYNSAVFDAIEHVILREDGDYTDSKHLKSAEILNLTKICKNGPNEEIENSFQLSQSSILSIKKTIDRKTNSAKITELIIYAIRNGYVDLN